MKRPSAAPVQEDGSARALPEAGRLPAPPFLELAHMLQPCNLAKHEINCCLRHDFHTEGSWQICKQHAKHMDSLTQTSSAAGLAPAWR